MIPVGILTAAATSSFSYLLDLYPGASVAYSLRKLRSTYTGNCIRVKRSSDNTTLDIGFVNNYVDSTAISTFCGSGNGSINLWYDQSGNSNNGGPSSSAEPQIYFSGSFLLQSGKIYIKFNPLQSIKLTTIITRTSVQNYSFWITYQKDSSANQAILLQGGSYMWLDYGQTAQFINEGFQVINITPNDYLINTRYLVNHICDTSTVTNYTNGNTWGNKLTTFTASVGVVVAESRGGGSITLNEFIIYSNSQAANKTGITNNINSYYTIY